MNNLLEYKDGYSLIPSSVSWENKMASGEGRAYGVGLWFVSKQEKQPDGSGMRWRGQIASLTK